MKVKVCGLKYPENIFDIASLGPDYLGFIFYDKSPRYVDDELNIELLNQLPKTIHKVGVFVNSEINYILYQVKTYQLEIVQLHGSESVKYCRELKEHRIKIIKAFQIEQGFDFNQLTPFKKVVDYFLFDTKTSN